MIYVLINHWPGNQYVQWVGTDHIQLLAELDRLYQEFEDQWATTTIGFHVEGWETGEKIHDTDMTYWALWKYVLQGRDV